MTCLDLLGRSGVEELSQLLHFASVALIVYIALRLESRSISITLTDEK